LRKPALALLKDYEKQKKEGKEPVYDPDESNLGIKNVEIWRRIAGRIKDKKNN